MVLNSYSWSRESNTEKILFDEKSEAITQPNDEATYKGNDGYL